VCGAESEVGGSSWRGECCELEITFRAPLNAVRLKPPNRAAVNVGSFDNVEQGSRECCEPQVAWNRVRDRIRG